MKIAIIGSGNMGRALAAAAIKGGHSVTIASAHAEKAKQVAEETGARAAIDNQAAVKGSELVLLAVPGTLVVGIVEDLGDAVAGKTLVDLTNRMNPEDPGSTLDGTSVTEQIQAKVPGAHVTKAFNTVLAASIANPTVDGVQLDAYVAGDDQQAKQQVVELANSMGFRGLDVGPQAIARVLEGMAALNVYLNMWNGWPWQSGWKVVGPTGN